MDIEMDYYWFDKGEVQDWIAKLNQIINDQLNEVIHHEKFQQLEATWKGLFDLTSSTDFGANVMIDMLDVSKEELQEDFDCNSVDFTKSALFQKIYVSVYEQFGGKPFGSIIGLYQFEHTPADLAWLKIMGKIAHASLAPFISSVKPQFFGCDSVFELSSGRCPEFHMSHPKYSLFNALRESEEAAYLVVPEMARKMPSQAVIGFT
ncbi:MAG: type VI secretion system contractile sheath large subunit [Parachlamydia sp.]|nr:type VI secretion system contractile sheath large subunit [Parachlamydia sp.]